MDAKYSLLMCCSTWFDAEIKSKSETNDDALSLVRHNYQVHCLHGLCSIFFSRCCCAYSFLVLFVLHVEFVQQEKHFIDWKIQLHREWWRNGNGKQQSDDTITTAHNIASINQWIIITKCGQQQVAADRKRYIFHEMCISFADLMREIRVSQRPVLASFRSFRTYAPIFWASSPYLSHSGLFYFYSIFMVLSIITLMNNKFHENCLPKQLPTHI